MHRDILNLKMSNLPMAGCKRQACLARSKYPKGPCREIIYTEGPKVSHKITLGLKYIVYIP